MAFHPILPGIICSGSDDRSIRIWNWTPSFRGQRQLRRLTGHSSYVRGLLWHSELPQILFSGSWDATIRVWDVAESRCIYTAYEHHADVYGPLKVIEHGLSWPHVTVLRLGRAPREALLPGEQ